MYNGWTLRGPELVSCRSTWKPVEACGRRGRAHRRLACDVQLQPDGAMSRRSKGPVKTISRLGSQAGTLSRRVDGG